MRNSKPGSGRERNDCEIQNKAPGGKAKRKLLFLLQKEFRQIRRNPFMIRAIIGVPVIQMLILIPAVTFEVKRIDLAVMDSDRSQASRELVAKLTGSSFFVVTAAPQSIPEAESMLFSGDADMILVIPSDFSEGLAGVPRPRHPGLG